jgi:hypothetical protein
MLLKLFYWFFKAIALLNFNLSNHHECSVALCDFHTHPYNVSVLHIPLWRGFGAQFVLEGTTTLMLLPALLHSVCVQLV